MKFATSIIALVAATAAYSKSINLQKRYEALSAECNNQWAVYRDCMSTPDDGLEKDKLCQIVQSQNCQNFYVKAEDLLSECLDSPQIIRRILPEKLAQINNNNLQYCTGTAANNAGNTAANTTTGNAGNAGNTAGNNNTAGNAGKTNNVTNSTTNNIKPANDNTKPAATGGNTASATTGGNTAADNTAAAGADTTTGATTGAATGAATGATTGAAGNTFSNVNAGNTTTTFGNSTTVGNNQSVASGASSTKVFTSLFVTLGLLMLSF